MAGCSSLPVPPSWQPAKPAREEDAEDAQSAQSPGTAFTQRSRAGGALDPSREWGFSPHRPLGMGISRFWQLRLHREGITGGGPGAQQRLCHVKSLFFAARPRWGGRRHRPRAEGTRGLCQPRKGGGSSRTQPPSTAPTASFGEMPCLGFPSGIPAPLGWNCAFLEERVGTQRGLGGSCDASFADSSPRSWHRAFFFNQISLKLSLARSIPRSGGGAARSLPGNCSGEFAESSSS